MVYPEVAWLTALSSLKACLVKRILVKRIEGEQKFMETELIGKFYLLFGYNKEINMRNYIKHILLYGGKNN